MRIWVLCYILRFHGNEGEWPQVNGKGFLTEKEAYEENKRLGGHYQIDHVEVNLNG